MITYYVFEWSKLTLIEQIFTGMSESEIGFYKFTSAHKVVEISSVPTSSRDYDREFLSSHRSVCILETDFRPEHAEIRAQAEIEAEFYSSDNVQVLKYLQTPDIDQNV